MFRQVTRRAFSTASAAAHHPAHSTGLAAPLAPIRWCFPAPIPTIMEPASEAEKNQDDWAQWEQAKVNMYVIASTIACGFLANHWFQKEKTHFIEHRWEQEPYPFFIDRSTSVGAGWWPGRHCQFFAFNCFSAAYAEADKLLAQKEAQEKKGGKKH